MILSIIFSFLLSSPASAQEIIQVQKTAQSELEDKTEAKTEIFKKIIEELSLENIQSLIGPEQVKKSESLIQGKVIKSYEKYVLSTKTSPMTKVDGKFEMTVDAQVSLKNLRDLLLKQGLLYQAEGPPKVLPIVRIVDRVNAIGYSWWAGRPQADAGFIRKLMGQFHNNIKENFHSIGFYANSPTSAKLRGSIPEAYQVEMPQRNDLLFLGQYLKTSLVLRGDILISRKPNKENVYLIDYRITGLHSGNGRIMAEVIRTFECEPGEMKRMVLSKFEETSKKVASDLASQLSKAWKTGTFGANLFRLTMKSKMSPQDVEDFKKLIVLHVRQIKSVRERLLQAGKITYEVDSSAVPGQLAEVFRKKRFSQYKVEVDGVAPDGMTIEVSRN